MKDIRLDFALGTTYTLDLLALIAAPLAFYFWRVGGQRGKACPRSGRLCMQSLRTNADHSLRIFHQWGGIHPPPRYERLYHYLEDSIVAVRPTTGHGVFHAKVWVLRYVRDDAPVRYRLLNLSRNLTFDHAWDLALVMEGELTTRNRAYAVNHPLGDFVAALPLISKTNPRREDSRTDLTNSG